MHPVCISHLLPTDPFAYIGAMEHFPRHRGLLGAIQSNLGASAVIAVGLEERIAREPAMTVGDLVDNIWSTNS